MQSGKDPRSCARCPEEAIVGLNSEWLCEICFGDALAEKRQQIDTIIAAFREIFVEEPELTVEDFDLVLTGRRFEEVRSPLLCGDDE